MHLYQGFRRVFCLQNNKQKVIDLKTKSEEIQKARFERYACQSVAKKALDPNDRIRVCLRYPLKGFDRVDIFKHRKTFKAFYGNLMTCGSVWKCPVCASKITERRRLELQILLAEHEKQGYKTMFLTLTFRHKLGEKLSDNLKKFKAVIKDFQSGKAYDEIRKKIDYIGQVRAFEITYSSVNGWHPHVHILLFFKEKRVAVTKIAKEMEKLYLKALEKNNAEGLEGIAFKLLKGEKAQEQLSSYFTKWSLENEMTKANTKKSRKKTSKTPFDLLRDYLESNNAVNLWLFREYAECMKGTKQLAYSPGLKKLYDIEEKTDEELAKEKIEQADLLGSLSLEEWQLVLQEDYRADFLKQCENKGFENAVEWLYKIIKKDTYEKVPN